MIAITKVDSADDTVKISGAKFKLQKGGTDVAGSEKETNANGVVEWTDLEYGATYTVVETEPGQGYDMPQDPNVYSATIVEDAQHQADSTAKVYYTDIVENTKTPVVNKGDLKIKKEVTVNGEEPAGAYQQDADGTYTFKLFYDLQCTQPVDGQQNITITITNGASNTALIEDLDEGTYYVQEDLNSLPADVSQISPRGNAAEVEVEADKTGDAAPVVTFTNNKTSEAKKGYLKFTKTVTGLDDTSLYDIITFKITGPDDFVKEFTYADVVQNGGSMVYGPDDGVLLGETYTVTETNSAIPQQTTDTETITYTRAAGEAVTASVEVASQSADAPSEMSLTNTYTKTTEEITHPVKISKKAVGGGDELDGATLQLKTEDGTVDYGSWTSSSADGPKEFELPAGTYTLTEIKAPKYYDVAESITFTVNTDGTVVVNGETVTDATVVMEDAEKTYEVEISKRDLDTSDYVVGAKLTITGDNLDQAITWTTEDGTNKAVSLKKGTYTLTEEAAPKGYKTVATFTFDVDEDDAGNVKITVTSSEAKVNGKVVTVFDEAEGPDVPKTFDFKITKADATNASKEIDGAKLQLIKVEGGKETIIRTWISSTTKVYTFKVQAGTTYKIKELEAPKGYELPNFTLSFTVDENGNATITDGKGEVVGKEIKFYNDPIKVETGGLKVIVEEEGTGRRVPDAVVEIEAPEGTTFPDGSKKITVTTDGNGEIKDYTDKDGNKIDLSSGLTPGDYKVTVIKVPEGYKVTTGKTDVVKVEANKVTEHIAKIETSSSTPEKKDTPSKTPNKTTTVTSSKAAKTGDAAPIALAVIALLGSLSVAVVLIIRKKKRA